MTAAIIITVTAFILFFFATLTETALTSCNRLRIELDIKQDKRYAIVADKLLESRVFIVLSFKLVRAFFVSLFTISSMWIVLHLQFAESLQLPLFILICTIAGAAVIVIPGSLLPKWIATRDPDIVLKNFYWFASVISILVKPLKIRRVDNPSMILEQEEEESAEAEIIHNAINFSDVLLRECMIPRTEVVAISSAATPDEILNLFRDSNYSRIPVYEGSIDRITGYIHSKDMLEGRKSVPELSRKIDYYPEDMGARDLLAIMIKNKSSIAVVLDKYGGTAGIITLEDLIEEIFGEISDELDHEEFKEKKTGEGEYVFSARLEIKYLNREYELEIPESDEYETLGGFITWFRENIPSQGEVLQYENMQITILRTTRSRVDLVRLKLLNV